MMFPPSPALSACDSLDGIDDLDAFLAAQGGISHFPTPPLKKEPVVSAVEVVETDDEDESLDYFHVATCFLKETSTISENIWTDVETVRQILLRADLPVEVIAMAFNILAGFADREVPLDRMQDLPLDLLVVSALNLAAMYNHDHPPSALWWSRHVCECTWTACRIDKAALRLLALLDFRLHRYTDIDRIDATVYKFTSSGLASPDESDYEEPHTPTEPPEKQPLKLRTGATFARWEHYQVNPSDTPPDSASHECKLPLGYFLPLL